MPAQDSTANPILGEDLPRSAKKLAPPTKMQSERAIFRLAQAVKPEHTERM